MDWTWKRRMRSGHIRIRCLFQVCLKNAWFNTWTFIRQFSLKPISRLTVAAVVLELLLYRTSPLTRSLASHGACGNICAHGREG